jgi:hypothetical protein
LLEHSEKWRLRENENPPKKRDFTKLDDDGSDNEGERNKGKPGGRKKANKRFKSKPETASLR